MTGIIIAIPKEAEAVLDYFNDIDETTLAGKVCYTGTVDDEPCALVVCEIGKVNAASATQALIAAYKPDRILNLGVCGGIADQLNICDLLIAEKSIQYDFDVTELDEVPVGYIQNMKTHMLPCDAKMFGALKKKFKLSTVVATADRFSSSESNAHFIRLHGGEVVDMELAAIAQVCLLNKVPVAAVKCVSDNARGDAKHDFTRMLARASTLLAINFPAILQAIK